MEKRKITLQTSDCIDSSTDKELTFNNTNNVIFCPAGTSLQPLCKTYSQTSNSNKSVPVARKTYQTSPQTKEFQILKDSESSRQIKSLETEKIKEKEQPTTSHSHRKMNVSSSTQKKELVSSQNEAKSASSAVVSQLLKSQSSQHKLKESSSTVSSQLPEFQLSQSDLLQHELNEPSLSKSQLSQSDSSKHELSDSESDSSRIKILPPSKCKSAGMCTCDTCEGWFSNTAVFTKNKPKHPSIKKYKPFKKVLPILKPHVNEKVQNERQQASLGSSVTERLAAPRLLVCGQKGTVPPPEKDLHSIHFHSNVRYILNKNKIVRPLRIQTYAWPAALRLNNVFLISPAGTGKTTTYAAVVCSGILETEDDDYDDDFCDPIAIVLCPSTLSTEEAYTIYGRIIDKKFIALISDRSETLHGRRDLLITTPPTLGELLNDRSVSLRRVKYIIFEDAHKLLELHKNITYALLRSMDTKLTMHYSSFTPVQVLVASHQWTSKIELLAQHLDRQPIVIIGAHLEAALYGQTQISINFTSAKEKLSTLSRLIKYSNPHSRVAIVCATDKDLQMSILAVNNAGIPYYIATEKAPFEDTADTQKMRKVRRPVIMCTDAMLTAGIHLTDADVVLHFSLPSSWSAFNFRFSLSFDRYKNDGQKNKNDKTSAIILIDESNTIQLPKLFDLLKRLNGILSEAMQEKYADIMHNKEKAKLLLGTSLCPSLRAFGYCNSMSVCTSRHQIDPTIDISSTSDVIPPSGLVRLTIVDVIDPGTYSARLIRHTDSEGITHDLSNNYSKITVQMALFNIQENVPDRQTIEVNNIYAVLDNDNVLHRCMLLKIDFGINTITVYLIDRGIKVENVAVTKLRELPSVIRDVPSQIVIVHLAGLGPCYNDDSYSKHAHNVFIQELKAAGYDKCETFFVGRIRLQLSNCLWFEDLRLMHHDNLDLLHRLSLRSTLLRLKLAEKRPNHLSELYKICTNNGMIMPDYDLPLAPPALQPVPDHPEPSWAHLNDGCDTYINIYIGSVDNDNPNLFYARLVRNDLLLSDFIDDINKAVNNPLYPKHALPAEGYCYLARDPNSGLYNRCQIRELILIDNEAKVFFVDYGDEAYIPLPELLPIRDDFITRLPFQAIHCRLWGVCVLNDHKDEAQDYLLELAMDPTSAGLLRNLYVKYVHYDTRNSAYSVLLFDLHDDSYLINEQLVRKNLYENESDRGNTPPYNIQEIFNMLSPQNPLDVEESNDEEDSQTTINLNIDFDSKNTVNKSTSFDWEKFLQNAEVTNAEEFLKILMFPHLQKSTSTSTQALPPLNFEGPIKSEYSTPTVIWSQTIDSVTIKISVPDVKLYELSIVRSSYLYFATTCQDIKYRLNISLSERVRDIVHEARGLYIYAKFFKVTPKEWNKLNIGKKRLRYIKYEFSDHNISDDEKENILTPLSTRGLKVVNGIEYFIDSSDEYSSSDINTDSDSDT